MLSRRLSIQQGRVAIALAMVALFVVGLLCKINFSSIGMWNSYLERRDRPAGLLAGAPQPIRSDEWFLGVPWLLSQVKANPPLPVSNPAIGPDTSALAVGLPTRHWTGVFRPAHWGFYFLNAEYGFSWYWLTRTVVCFAALALLFLELSGGALSLAILGASWVYFSAFTQWWLGSVAELLLYFSSACLALRWLAIASGGWRALGAALLLLLSAVAFAITLYPPFQIPLTFLGLSITPLLLSGALRVQHPSKPARLALFGVSVVTGLSCVALFMLANSEVFKAMEGTVYPGKRVSLGGGVDSLRYFSGFFDQLNSFERFPGALGNVCEASSLIFAWPFSALVWLFSCLARAGVKSSPVTADADFKASALTLAPLFLYLVLVTAWCFIGVNEAVASATLWSYVPVTRAFIGLGVGGAIFSVVVLSGSHRLGALASWVVSALALVWLWWLTQQYASRLGQGFTSAELYFAASVVGLLIISIVWSFRWGALLAIFLACVYPHSTVNPVMSGISVLSSSKLARAVSRFDPNKRGSWIVFGSMINAQLVKTSGRKVINGSQYLPNFELLRKLDPEGQHNHIYNRYAHVVYEVGSEGTPPTFALISPDVWQLTVDPCHPLFRDLGIDYIVTAPRPKHSNFKCLERVYIEGDFALYKPKK